MKINATILAAALGLTSVTLANATQYVYLTGSTAARGAVFNTLTNSTSGIFDTVNPTVFGSYGSTVSANGSYMEFSNTISGTPTIVKCDWSGSEAGIADVSGSLQEAFPADFGVGSVAPGTTATKPSGTGLVTNLVDLAMADNALIYSKNPTSTAIQSANPVVIVPFVFVKTTTPIADQAAFSNISDNDFKVLAAGGDALTLFTGNPADVNNNVYLAGRDNNSGTRVNTFDETGWGSGKNPTQIELSNGQLMEFGSIYTTPSGQSSGGTLAGSLTNTIATKDLIADPSGNTVGIIAVAYLGLADDVTAEAAPLNATRLTYNGVAYSVSAVENGLYTLWGNEYVLQKAGDTAADVTDVFTGIENNAQNNTDGFEIPLSDMNVSRSGPNSVVSY